MSSWSQVRKYSSRSWRECEGEDDWFSSKLGFMRLYHSGIRFVFLNWLTSFLFIYTAVEYSLWFNYILFVPDCWLWSIKRLWWEASIGYILWLAVVCLARDRKGHPVYWPWSEWFCYLTLRTVLLSTNILLWKWMYDGKNYTSVLGLKTVWFDFYDFVYDVIHVLC